MDNFLFFIWMSSLILTNYVPHFLPSSSVSLSNIILAVPMRQCLGKHS